MLPQTVKVLGHTYSVVTRDQYIAESSGGTGQVNNYVNRIWIDSSLAPSTQNEVLIHEIIEAINYRCELNMEHRTICVLGEVLHQVLRDNRLRFDD